MLYILNFAAQVNQFSQSAMLAAKDLGLDFHIAGHFSYPSHEALMVDEERLGIRIHHIDYRRNPLHGGNLRAHRQLTRLMAKQPFDLVHCNTPIGGVTGRLAARRHKIPAVIYQAHGFHFYKGSPASSWLLYYPVEKALARMTDLLITINREDYELASQRFRTRMPNGVVFLPGIGIDWQRYDQVRVDRSQKRAQLGVPVDAALALAVGELNANKNHGVLIRALSKVEGLHLAIAGRGPLLEELKALAAAQGVGERVHFLGFRRDIPEVYQAADIFCLASFREGLSASVMEAMASGLPLVISDIRGNRDLLIPGEGGVLVPPRDSDAFARAFNQLSRQPNARSAMGAFNAQQIQSYGLEVVRDQTAALYQRVLNKFERTKT